MEEDEEGRQTSTTCFTLVLAYANSVSHVFISDAVAKDGKNERCLRFVLQLHTYVYSGTLEQLTSAIDQESCQMWQLFF